MLRSFYLMLCSYFSMLSKITNGFMVYMCGVKCLHVNLDAALIVKLLNLERDLKICVMNLRCPMFRQ